MGNIFLLELGKLLEIFVDVRVQIVKAIAVIAGFGAEHDHQNKLNAAEWKEDPEAVFPSQVGRNRSCDDRNQIGDGAEDEIEQ